MLIADNYKWDDKVVALSSLSRACKLKNDVVRTRLPIHYKLLETILFEVQRMFRKKVQPYLEMMYKALIVLGYYGLMHVGELTHSQHVLKARDVLLGTNKDKLLLVLYSSKTHDIHARPQKIKITANKMQEFKQRRHFCPFQLVSDYIKIRPEYVDENDPFFIFSDGVTCKSRTY